MEKSANVAITQHLEQLIDQKRTQFCLYDVEKLIDKYCSEFNYREKCNLFLDCLKSACEKKNFRIGAAKEIGPEMYPIFKNETK